MRIGVERIDGDDPGVDRTNRCGVGDIALAHQLRQLPRHVDVVEVGRHDRLQRGDRASRVLPLQGDLGDLHVGAVGAGRDGHERRGPLERAYRFVEIPRLAQLLAEHELHRIALRILRRERPQSLERHRERARRRREP